MPDVRPRNPSGKTVDDNDEAGRLPAMPKSTTLQTTAVLALALLLGNVSAVVDALLHPEIPYFDREHVVVGGVTALVSAALSLLLLHYARRLGTAVETIHRLEAILPICANCKKIRRSGADPKARESWQALDSYLTENTDISFSHGICPECVAALYPEYVRELQGEERQDLPSKTDTPSRTKGRA